MAQFGTTVAWNFRDLLADIADTGPDDIISWEVDGDLITGQFRLDDGFTASLLSEPTGGFIGLFGPDVTDGVASSAGGIDLRAGPQLTDLATLPSYFDGTYDAPTPAFEDEDNFFVSTDQGTVFVGFETDDALLGLGVFKGRGGDDVITFWPLSDHEPGTMFLGTGGAGDDRLVSSVEKARLFGGFGDDQITAVAGRTISKGGAGSDTFTIASGLASSADRVNLVVKDFEVGTDRLAFDFENYDVSTGRNLTLADAFGSGTLADISNGFRETIGEVRVGAVTMTFTETEAGDSVITRSGTDLYGTAFDDRMVIKDTGLAEINRADVDLVNAPYFVDMSNPAGVVLLGAVDTRVLLDDITDTTSADVLSDVPAGIDAEVVFAMNGGFVASIDRGNRLEVYAAPNGSVEGDPIAIFQHHGSDPLTIESLAEFEVLLTAAAEETAIIYNVIDSGATAVGNGVQEFMIGAGTFKGRGGDDLLALEDYDVETPTALGWAYGGAGNDRISVDLDRAWVFGGDGDDLLFFVDGRAAAKGGNGADLFSFQSANTQHAEDARVRRDKDEELGVNALLKDFDPEEDTIEFLFSDARLFEETTDVTLAELYGAGTLATLGTIDVDGVDMTFTENGNGDAVITRLGTDTAGREYDERVVLRDHALADLERSDITLSLTDDILGA